MLDRASSFSHPEIVALLQEEFVPVAIDQAYQRRQKDAEGRFYQRIADQGPRPVGDGGPTTQGHYTAAPDGRFLGYGNHRDPQRLLAMLRDSLERYRPGEVSPIEPGEPDRRFVYSAPEGGLIVRVFSRVLGGYDAAENSRSRIFQDATGRDNLWVREDEHRTLVGGDLPPSLVSRMLRFHCVDNTRGEPPMWEESEILETDLRLEDGVVRGSLHLATSSGEREFRADVLGFVDVAGGEIVRFDLVVRGRFRGEGRYTRGAPEGEFPFAVVLTLADGTDIADTIPPQGSRGWLEGYIR